MADDLTCFTPSRRLSRAAVRRQAEDLAARAAELLEFLPGAIVILNRGRQIVWASRDFRRLAQCDDVVGLRPGEALGCLLVPDATGGCGTGLFCRSCGMNAALGRQGPTDEELSIVRRRGSEDERLVLRAQAAPLSGEDGLVVFSVADIRDEARRRALSEVFLHDLLNTATGLQTLTFCLKDESDEAARAELTGLVTSAAEQIVSEILGHRALMGSPDGAPAAECRSVRSRDLVVSVLESYRRHPLSAGKHLVLDPVAEQVELLTDPVLLGRVLANLVRNALEACRDGQAVICGCRRDEGRVRFTVHNPGVISEGARKRIFHGPFSTKGADRGFGTWGVKLIAEGLLRGKVTFVSSEKVGTTFTVACPLAPPPEA
ncbi:MAG: sensor histidine kinase [Planctomycetes bacterium]|nr:sensor histidine kinase [Planctomycetota bacterium]